MNQEEINFINAQFASEAARTAKKQNELQEQISDTNDSDRITWLQAELAAEQARYSYSCARLQKTLDGLGDQ